jgi:histidine triad (HIT) family protein
MSDCLFCKIVDGDIPCDLLHEDDHVIAFRDINPQAPHHVLVIPRRHIASLAEVGDDDTELMGRLKVAAVAVAEKLGLAESGYRLVVNCGPDALQTVMHLHVHLLGGRTMSWPPG